MNPLSLENCLINSIQEYQVCNGLKGVFLADKIVSQQIIDIPEHRDRIHFDETNSETSLETNRKHINRYLNREEKIPLRLVPTILRVIGLFPQTDQSKLDDFGHLSKTAKESLEAVERYRVVIHDGIVTPKEVNEVWKEGMEGIMALLGMMLYIQHKSQTKEECKWKEN